MMSNHNNYSRTIIVIEPKGIEPTQKADQFTYINPEIYKAHRNKCFKGLTQNQMLD
jgi:hypothetical protein